MFEVLIICSRFNSQQRWGDLYGQLKQNWCVYSLILKKTFTRTQKNKKNANHIA